MTTIYQPTEFEVQGATYIAKCFPEISAALQSNLEHFDEVRAEAGPHIDEYARLRLEKANDFIKASYQMAAEKLCRAYSENDNT